MANSEHIRILEAGVSAWNRWREDNRIIHPDLNRAQFWGKDLSGINFEDANLAHAHFRDCRFVCAQFSNADATCVNFDSTIFKFSTFVRTKLSRANFYGASLIGTMFWKANLSGARLKIADMLGTFFGDTDLTEADFTGASCRETTFANVDLRDAKGLQLVKSVGAQTVGIDTIYKSQGRIPDTFLSDAGVPEEIIDLARTIRAGPPIQWHSCFISYSTKDDEFARRLHSRMREANMRVWFAPEDLKGGKKLHEQLFEAIQLNDRLLLVLSKHSIQSGWVMSEIRKARETEKKEKRRKLFPIRLTKLETLRDWACFDADTGKDLAVELREYFIPDFSNWKDHDAFETAFARLQKDLQAEDQRRTT